MCIPVNFSPTNHKKIAWSQPARPISAKAFGFSNFMIMQHANVCWLLCSCQNRAYFQRWEWPKNFTCPERSRWVDNFAWDRCLWPEFIAATKAWTKVSVIWTVHNVMLLLVPKAIFNSCVYSEFTVCSFRLFLSQPELHIWSQTRFSVTKIETKNVILRHWENSLMWFSESEFCVSTPILFTLVPFTRCLLVLLLPAQCRYEEQCIPQSSGTTYGNVRIQCERKVRELGNHVRLLWSPFSRMFALAFSDLPLTRRHTLRLSHWKFILKLKFFSKIKHFSLHMCHEQWDQILSSTFQPTKQRLKTDNFDPFLATRVTSCDTLATVSSS